MQPAVHKDSELVKAIGEIKILFTVKNVPWDYMARYFTSSHSEITTELLQAEISNKF